MTSQNKPKAKQETFWRQRSLTSMISLPFVWINADGRDDEGVDDDDDGDTETLPFLLRPLFCGVALDRSALLGLASLCALSALRGLPRGRFAFFVSVSCASLQAATLLRERASGLLLL